MYREGKDVTETENGWRMEGETEPDRFKRGKGGRKKLRREEGRKPRGRRRGRVRV